MKKFTYYLLFYTQFEFLLLYFFGVPICYLISLFLTLSLFIQATPMMSFESMLFNEIQKGTKYYEMSAQWIHNKIQEARSLVNFDNAIVTVKILITGFRAKAKAM